MQLKDVVIQVTFGMLWRRMGKIIKRLVVDVDLIPPKPLHTYYNNKFALQIYTQS
jgi:hypothetical protein